MASYGLLKGLGSAFNKTADDWGEQLREERIRAYQDKVRQKEWDREDQQLEKQQAMQQEQAQSQVADYRTVVGDDGNQYTVGYNAQGDAITDPVLSEKASASYDHVQKVGDDLVDVRTGQPIYQGESQEKPNIRTLTMDTSGEEKAFEVTRDEQGNAVMVPVRTQGGNLSSMEEDSLMSEARSAAEEWADSQAGWLSSDDEDFKQYGGNRQEAIQQKTMEYFQQLKAARSGQQPQAGPSRQPQTGPGRQGPDPQSPSAGRQGLLQRGDQGGGRQNNAGDTRTVEVQGQQYEARRAPDGNYYVEIDGQFYQVEE